MNIFCKKTSNRPSLCYSLCTTSFLCAHNCIIFLVLVSGEVCFLLAGVYITYCIRNARTEIYREKWTLCWIIYIELIVSSPTYIIRHIFSQRIHPDVIFLLYFARCQLTVSLALILLFLPKVRVPLRVHYCLEQK